MGEHIDVSVIVAVRNGAATLHQCLDSALAQTGCRIEIIVVDAMSEDGTEDIVRSFGSNITSYVRERDDGIYDAWNKALHLAQGSWCTFLGADDYFLAEDALEQLMRCAEAAGPRPAFAHGGILRTGGASEFVIHPDPADVRRHLRSGRMLPHQGFLHCTQALRDVGGFDAAFRVLGDLDAALRLLQAKQAVRCPSVVVAMRIGGISTAWESQRLMATEKFRLLRRERGMMFAVQFYVLSRSMQIVGRSVETLLTQLMGSQRGTRLILRIRSVLRRPSKRL